MSFRTATSLPELRVDELVSRDEFISAHAFDLLVRDKHLVPLTESIARLAHVASTPRLRARALARMIPAHAIIGHTSAAWIYFPRLGATLSGLVPADAIVPHRLELHRGPVTCLYSRDRPRPRTSPTRDYHLERTRFEPADVIEVNVGTQKPVLVTSTERTILDLVCRAESTSIFAALREFESAGVDITYVHERLVALQRWRGKERGLATLDAYKNLQSQPS